MIVGSDKKQFLAKIFKHKSHPQAFLITGDEKSREELSGLLLDFLWCENKINCRKCENCKIENRLDLHTYEGPDLKIEAARDILIKASATSWSGAKVFLIKARALSFDAQTTLLKTLEEPNPGAYFILSRVSTEDLSSPLRSRLTHFSLPPRSQINSKKNSEATERKSLKKELEVAQVISKEKEKILLYFESLELWASSNIKIHPKNGMEFAGFIEEMFQAKERFFKKTYFNRMLLEHVIISKAYLEK